MNTIELAKEIRMRLVEMSHHANTAHLAGALSCVDILACLYAKELKMKTTSDPKRDRVIFSKGHAVSALYATLALTGFLPVSNLRNFNQPGANLPEQPCPKITPGVEWATGSLGHGLGVALGIAMGLKLKQSEARVFTILSDGECQEGSVWEAAMLAPKLELTPITAIVDFNKWQATGRSNQIMAMEPLSLKWESFGWAAIEIDGHNHQEIIKALESITKQPKAIIAHTIKGKGISFIEDDNNWHYRSPSAQEVELARRELEVPLLKPLFAL